MNFHFKSIGQTPRYQSLIASNLLSKQCLNNLTLIEKAFLQKQLKNFGVLLQHRKHTCDVLQPKESLDIHAHMQTHTSIALQKCLKQPISDVGFSNSCVKRVAFSLVIYAVCILQFVHAIVYLELSQVHYLAKI